MAYIGPIIVLITGILGIFFSKSGERQRLHVIAYVLLALLVVSGAISLFGVYDARRDAREAWIKASNDASRAAAEAALKETALRREKAAADAFRNLLIARTFAPNDLPADGLLLLDLPRTPAEQRQEDDPNGVLWPMLGKGVRAAHLTFMIEDVLDLDYRMRAVAKGAEIKADWYAFGPKTCQLVSPDSYTFTPAPGSPCLQEDGYALNAGFQPTAAGGDSFLITLPHKRFWKIYSRLDQTQRLQNTVGQLVIEAEDAKALSKIMADAANIAVSLKFFRGYSKGDAHEDQCATTLVARLTTTVRKTTPTTVVIDIGGAKDSEVNFCEISLAS